MAESGLPLSITYFHLGRALKSPTFPLQHNMQFSPMFPYKYCISLTNIVYCIFVGRYTGLYNNSGHLQKGTILYRVWRNDRWFVGNKKIGVVSHLIVGGGGGGLGVFSPRKCLYFSIPMTAIFWNRFLDIQHYIISRKVKSLGTRLTWSVNSLFIL